MVVPSVVGWAATLAFGLLVLCSLSGVARAGTITPEDIDPAFFSGPGIWGFPSSVTGQTQGVIDTADFDVWPLLGRDFQLTQSLQPPIQNPQALGEDPGFANPFIADSIWSVTNTSDTDYLDFRLLILRVSDWDFEGFPEEGVGFDASIMSAATHAGGGSPLFFLSLDFGPLARGETRSAVLRYVIAGDLPLVEVEGVLRQVLPTLGVTGLATVPEPATVVLLGLGIVGLVALGSKRRWE